MITGRRLERVVGNLSITQRDISEQPSAGRLTASAPDYADLIAESPVAGFLPNAELSSATIRRVLGTG